MAEAKAETKEKRTRFVKWIDDTTAKTIAAKLGVTVWTVYGWRRHAMGEPGGFRPDPSRLGEILTLSGGALTSADIYPKPKSKK